MNENSLPSLTDTRAIRITGGHRLEGTASVQGSKNVALHLYAASVLADEPLTLTGIPQILDTQVCAEILNRTGTPAAIAGDRFETRPAAAWDSVIPDEAGRRIRTTAVMAAGVLARVGRVRFPLPGGDAFCHRRIDRHLAAMEAAGARMDVTGTHVEARLTGRGPARFTTDAMTEKWGPSLGATVTAMLLAARARGTSTILHPNTEPEVAATASMLADRGVGITWDGTNAVHITGTDHIAGGTVRVPPDRLEAATLALAAGITGGSVHLENFPTTAFPAALAAVLADAGIELLPAGDGTLARCPDGPRPVHAATTSATCTDVQPQLTAFLTQAPGTSRIEERIYTSRATHVDGLRAFGAAVTAGGPTITVHGPSPLTAACAAGQDIRAVAALVLAALAATGTSTIHGIYHLHRGYDRLLDTLASLGAEITVVQDPKGTSATGRPRPRARR
ncbi:UDP-N-acetylglucosamine 1-carboxyvinyltransferase [Streptomyces bambusae]|uniref:UDP-N-acetylglucosamine 1-carboxyvinyltransferase n=1 Tax=Streptomyces bambusae TaxID=1550616 RepID=UPI001CFFA9A4|nr:UDP-N-acetylglucosamine 1-carboxyvinyltransferase [Streptomyces bambusae]MCB5170133.1 UDP-N-acetylglucosamine 1-carboxyvinyltransferase [Streptomyces bambusae]